MFSYMHHVAIDQLRVTTNAGSNRRPDLCMGREGLEPGLESDSVQWAQLTNQWGGPGPSWSKDIFGVQNFHILNFAQQAHFSLNRCPSGRFHISSFHRITVGSETHDFDKNGNIITTGRGTARNLLRGTKEGAWGMEVPSALQGQSPDGGLRASRRQMLISSYDMGDMHPCPPWLRHWQLVSSQQNGLRWAEI